MINVGIFGGSGYTGQELLRILLAHPAVRVTVVTSRRYAGQPVADVFPSLRDVTDLTFVDADAQAVAGQCESVFLAVPHGEAMAVVPDFLAKDVRVIDLSADYRLRDPVIYETWYRQHTSPDLIADAVYGLPELYRDEIRTARLIANPGCYPTGAILGMAPLIRQGLVDSSNIIVDAKSGTSGAGREAKIDTLFCEVNEGFKAYKIFSHRHTPEIDQELSIAAGDTVRVLFTPHLVPVSRGILTTMYASMARPVSSSMLEELYHTAYGAEPFVRVYPTGRYPNISFVRGSNYCDIAWAVDADMKKVVIITALDNLVKGAAGQAVQNLNIMNGFDEDAGLRLLSVVP